MMKTVLRLAIAVVGVVMVIGALAGVKIFQFKKMQAYGENAAFPPSVVTTAVVQPVEWESFLTAVGSLDAVQGVTMTAELSGKVVRIAFEAGGMAEAGDLLVQQDISEESARLRAAEAGVTLARINLDRARELVALKTVSQSDFDNAEAGFKQAMAQADNIRALISKKTIRAPFTGRLGIRQVNLGQVLKEGDPIVSLQSLDPIYADFLLPQHQLAQVSDGMQVRLTSDGFPDQVITGKITAINPQVNSATRHVGVQATVANPEGRLRPGMYVSVTVVLPGQLPVLTIPSTAVLYAPYGDSVFVVEKAPIEKSDGKPGETSDIGPGEGKGSTGLHLRQQFVRLGEKRGDFVQVISGLEAGSTVVSTGVFKLRNGQAVVVDNKLNPEFKQSPEPADA